MMSKASGTTPINFFLAIPVIDLELWMDDFVAVQKIIDEVEKEGVHG